MTTPLDSILSSDRASAPSPAEEKPAEVTTQQVTETEKPAPQEQADDTPSIEHEGQKMVPKAALDEARSKTKRYTEQVADFQRQLQESNTAWERRLNQVLERLTPQQQQQLPQEKPDFFADPDAAIRAYINAAISPIVQHSSQMSEDVSRRFAMQEHGKDVVQAAYGEMERRLSPGPNGIPADPIARNELARIMQSGDQWGELVKWHKRNSAIAEIGEDPNAYREKVKAEILAELQQGGSPASAPGIMPSNIAGARNVGSRSGPAWGGPASITDIFNRKRA